MATKLNQTYAYYVRELRRVQTEMVEIHAKIAALEEAGATMPDATQGVFSLQAAPALDEPDAGPTLTERAFGIVDALPEGKKMRRVDVGRAIRAQGFVPKGKNFHVTLFKTLVRLKTQGRIFGEKTDGVWLFSSKKNSVI